VLSRGRVLLVAGFVALFSMPVPTAAASTDEQIESTRDAIDELAQRWFDSQQDVDSLDAEIAGLEREVHELQVRADEVATIARARAVEIYMGSGTDLGPVLDGVDALDSARRAELLDRANEQSRRALDDFETASERLTEHRSELDQRRSEQAAAAERLSDEQQSLEQQLAALQSQAAREAAAVRARQAASAAAAAPRAAATPATRAASTPRAQPQPQPTPPPPPSSGGTHPHHDDPFLACTRNRESRGNYGVVSASGLYHGAYQFLPTTWNATASHAGRAELIGVLPSRASVYDQDDMAWTLYQWQGKGPWGGRC
jgi:peptidoglycan hydrolase CwlO-like protein